MEKNREIPEGIYGITDGKSGAGKNILDYSEEILKGGVKILQYREKKKCAREKFEEAIKLKELTKKYNAIFIVNDDIALALAVDADGVHIGQDDLPLKEVRKIVGENKIVGISTHCPEEAKKAEEEGADYIGVGPIFSTETKEDVCAPLGFEYLEYVEKNVKIPYVAIGGLKLHNLNEMITRGCKRFAIVSEIVGATNTLEKTIEIANYIKNNVKK
ncbi:MAG: thiamine phosphate synthase [Fusobacteriaceae bacterium]